MPIIEEALKGFFIQFKVLRRLNSDMNSVSELYSNIVDSISFTLGIKFIDTVRRILQQSESPHYAMFNFKTVAYAVLRSIYPVQEIGSLWTTILLIKYRRELANTSGAATKTMHYFIRLLMCLLPAFLVHSIAIFKGTSQCILSVTLFYF